MFNKADIKIIRGIRAVVAERGEDWRYPKVTPRRGGNDDWYRNGQCVNLLPDKSGACIVGTAACEADMYIERTTPLRVFTDMHGVSHRVSEALSRAQLMQDRSKTWGECLSTFENELGIVGVKV